MRRRKLTTMGLSAIFAAVLFAAVQPAKAQDAKTPYPSMAPLEQYLIADRNAEVTLAKSAAPKAISVRSKLPLMTTPQRARHHVARLNSEHRATARYRAATLYSIFPAARRCSRPPICGTGT